MAMSTDSIVAIACNLGAVIFIAVRVVDKVEKHQEILPKLVEAVNNINESAKQHIEAIKDLYEKHNDLSDKFHELLGEHKTYIHTRVKDTAAAPKNRIDGAKLSE